MPLVTEGVETVLQPPATVLEVSSTHAAPLLVHVRDATFVPFIVSNPPNINAGATGGLGTSTETFPNEDARLSRPQLHHWGP